MHILCIDGNSTFSDTLRRWLQPHIIRLMWEYAPSLALGLPLLQLAREEGEPFDVLLLDLLLPGETLGLLSIPQLRNDYPDMTIIGLSGADNGNGEPLSYGAKIFVTKKPGSEQTILSTLQALEDQHAGSA